MQTFIHVWRGVLYNPDMTPHDRFMLLMALIGVLTLGGLLVIIALLILWRRFNARQNALIRKERVTTAYHDAWNEAGQRYKPAAEDDETDDDHDQDERDEEDDDDQQDDDKRHG